MLLQQLPTRSHTPDTMEIMWQQQHHHWVVCKVFEEVALKFKFHNWLHLRNVLDTVCLQYICSIFSSKSFPFYFNSMLMPTLCEISVKIRFSERGRWGNWVSWLSGFRLFLLLGCTRCQFNCQRLKIAKNVNVFFEKFASVVPCRVVRESLAIWLCFVATFRFQFRLA